MLKLCNAITRLESRVHTFQNKELGRYQLFAYWSDYVSMVPLFAYWSDYVSMVPLFAYWSDYVSIVPLLLQFIKAERIGDWLLPTIPL
ncbi:hypothetical protein LSAT2_007636 [Lamellibrachia satsuma]|nr:hypothetical protein LSAT2_007636 [Lamellibrachia satsuma]